MYDTLENDQIRVVLKIPLINTKERYDIFKLHNIPVPFYNTPKLDKVKHCLVKYELGAGLLMFSKNREEYALLSENDYYMCNRHKLHFCSPKAIFYPTNMNKLCVVALFMKDQSDVKRFCKQTVVLNQKQTLARYLSLGIGLL